MEGKFANSALHQAGQNKPNTEDDETCLAKQQIQILRARIW